MADPIFFAPWALAIAGAFIGSFLNVCIHRMPAHRSIVWPGSACPACGAPIAPWHNIPILSWLALRGRCASCRAPIALRYPLIEALTGIAFVVAWLRFGPTWDLAGALVFLPMLIVLFFTDLDERVLPDLVTLPGTAAGLVFAFASAATWPIGVGGWRPPVLSLGVAAATAAVAAGSFWLVGYLWRFVRPGLESAMGLGDVKMMAMVGAFLGPMPTLLTVFLGSLLGTLVFALTRLLAGVLRPEPAGHGPRGLLARGLESAGFLVGGEGAGLQDQIPFGSFLAMGAAIAFLWGDRLIAAYLAFTGLRP
jgi:leader peptidase (prepilin peptidase)/N-methyltransferase